MNVVLITTDQHRWDTVSAYGAGRCATPHIDRLAARGTRFTRAYTPHPLCQPARASILSGLYASRHGVWNNGVDVGADLEPGMLSSRLAAAGWRTGFCGKGHFSTAITDAPTGRPENFKGSENYDPAGWDGPYVGFDWNRLVLLGHYPATAIAPPQGMHYTASLFAEGEDRAKALIDAMAPNPALAPQTWYSDLPYEHHPTHFTGEAGREFLRDQAPGGQPFFVWISFADPHHPLDPARPFAGMHDPADVLIPDLPSDDELAAKPASHRQWGWAEGDVIEYLNPGWLKLDEAQRRQMTAAYFDMIAACDHEIGGVLDTLDAQGLTGDTTVIFTSDHGELLGDHGLLFKGPFHYESLVRVPLIVAGPAVAAGAEHTRIVSTLDLAPTVLDLAGLPIDGLDGQPLLDGSTRESAVVECDYDIHWIEPIRTVITDDAKLTVPWAPRTDGGVEDVDPGRPGELYLLEEDPAEVQNRWDDPGSRSRREDLLALLREEVHRTPRRDARIGRA